MYRKFKEFIEKSLKEAILSQVETLKFCQKSPLPKSLRFAFRIPPSASHFTESPFETCCFIYKKNRIDAKKKKEKKEKTKCMLVGSNRKLESKMALTVSIFDHNVNNVNSFKYFGIFLSSDFTWTYHVEYIAGKINQRLGLLNRIKHLLPFSAPFITFYYLLVLFYNSFVMPLFDYADLVWGDKHNVTLMTSLQLLQNKAAKIILDRPFYSSATYALATLKWVSLEKKAFSKKMYLCVLKCLNGLVEHDINSIDSKNNMIIMPELS